MIRNVTKEIVTALNQLAHVGVINDEAMVAISGIVANELNGWKDEVAEELNRQMKNWEETQGEADSTLFTLGLRRARDLVLGASALANLPVLETENTPSVEEGEDG